MRVNKGIQSISAALFAVSAQALQSPAWSSPESAAANTAAPIQPVVITMPKPNDFPGSAVTLTQPVNVLQPIPPAAIKAPVP
jgi:hypothetical protein